jgi:hypothetical protein
MDFFDIKIGLNSALFVTSSHRGGRPRRCSGNCSSYPKWHARDSNYVRTALRSLGVYDLIAAAEWRELTSCYLALKQSDRTYDRSIQANATLHRSQ